MALGTIEELSQRYRERVEAAEAKRRAEFEALFAASPSAQLVGPPRAARLHLDYLALTLPPQWLAQPEVRAWTAYQHGSTFPASPNCNALGQVLSPVLAVDGEHDAETIQVSTLIADGFDRRKGNIYCNDWFGPQVVGWTTVVQGTPVLHLTGAVLRRLGWQSAYLTAVELLRRLSKCDRFNVSRVDVAVEYGVIDFERLRAYKLEQATSNLALDMWSSLAADAGRRKISRKLIDSDDGTTNYVKLGSQLMLRIYHKKGEGVRVEFEIRRPRPSEGADPHAQVSQAVEFARQEFGKHRLPYVAEEPAVPVDPETGEVLYAGVGTQRQKVRTLWRRGLGLCAGVLQDDEDLLRRLLDLGYEVESLIAQRYPAAMPPPRWTSVESLEAQWAQERSNNVG